MVTEMIPEMVTIREAAKRTGLSYDCIYKLIQAGEIVYFRAGKKYFVNFGRFCEYLNNGKG